MLKRILKHHISQKIVFIIVILVIWELIARSEIFPALLFPSFSAVMQALFSGISSEKLLSKTWFSLFLIIKGLSWGLLIVLFLSYLGISFAVMENILNTLIAILDPLPGIALLPVAMLWFGISEASIIFIILHSIIWSMLLSFMTGFKSVPRIYLDVGQNFGLGKAKLLWDIMVPASFPYLISGLKIGWARAWRAVIAVEMVFGAASGTAGGLGWHIYTSRYFSDIAGTFAALVAIVIVGILVEELIFKTIEKATVKKWGMSI